MQAPAFSTLALLLVQVAAILLVARTLGFVTRRVGQPEVIAEVLAGIVLGPSLLGALWPEGMAALFPSSSFTVLKLLSELGLVLFMFLVGLELDAKLLKGRAGSSLAISHASIVVPFALGGLAAFWLYRPYSSPDVPFPSFFLFLGTAMSVTAFPVLARILSERHLLGSRVGAIAITCAAAGDVTAWCILAFVVAVVHSEGVLPALSTAGLALVFVFAMVYLVRPFLVRLGSHVLSREGLTRGVIGITLLLLLISASIAEAIGIHALFGAYLFGAILPKEGRLAEALADRIETVAVVLLLPLFFAYSGLHTQIGLLNEPRDWIVAGALILVATIGKFGGSSLAARMTGLRWREANAIGILMNTRGLMELVVLNIGRDLGVISPTVFTMLVIMAIVTTIATTPVLHWVYPESELLRDRLKEPEEAPASHPPYTVLMCVSDGTAGPALAELARTLAAKRDQRARLLALHLFSPSDRPSVERRRSYSGAEEGPLAPLLEAARSFSLPVEPLAFVSTAPALDICRTAELKQASLILLGAHKPLLLGGKLSGTVSDVMASAKSPVAVLVDRGLTKIQRVLVAYAGASEDLEALRLAQRIGEAPGTELTLLHVVKPGSLERPGKGRAQIADYLRNVPSTEDQLFTETELASKSLRIRVVEHASPAEAVLEQARTGYDLVVLGVNARWGLDGGIVSPRRRRVLAESPVSILAVQPPLLGAAEAPTAPAQTQSSPQATA